MRAALYALVPRGVVLGLDPVRAALAHSGNPPEHTRAVHLAGTNGKGSVAAMVDAASRHAGDGIGMYTSPHLHRFAERIRVDGGPARDAIAEVARALGAPLHEAPPTRVIDVRADGRARVRVQSPRGALVLDLALAGAHQAGNAAVAVGVLDRLGVPEGAIAAGIAR